MRKSIKIMGTIGTMTILLCGAYLLGTTQVKTITVVKEVEKRVEIVPDGYMSLNVCIPLEDIACYFISDIMEGLEDETEDFRNNFVDMRQVTDFEATENGLQLYLSDGSGYYWER